MKSVRAENPHPAAIARRKTGVLPDALWRHPSPGGLRDSHISASSSSLAPPSPRSGEGGPQGRMGCGKQGMVR